MLVDDPSLDYVFTTGMPIGINIYGVNVKALKTVCAVKKQIDTEIWGPLINRPEIFNVRELSAKKEYVQKNYRLTLDEEDDYKVIKAIYDNFGRNEIVNVIKVYEFLSMNPSVAKINKNVVQKSLDEFKLLNIDNYYSKEKSSILNTKSRIYKD
jgi:spore coat polysaccharide biosynthesis protein SpsF